MSKHPAGAGCPEPAAAASDPSSIDVRYMKRALALARRSGRRVRPNPNVGALVVQGGSVVGAGWHQRAGSAHAEAIALQRAGAQARGATLYVTLEPCNHHGRTPPCTEAILAAGVVRVVYASADPNPGVAGGGARRLRDAGIEVSGGVLSGQADALVAPWRTWVTEGGALEQRVEAPMHLLQNSGEVAVERCLIWGKKRIVPFVDAILLSAEAAANAAPNIRAVFWMLENLGVDVLYAGTSEPPPEASMYQRILTLDVRPAGLETAGSSCGAQTAAERCLAELSDILAA